LCNILRLIFRGCALNYGYFPYPVVKLVMYEPYLKLLVYTKFDNGVRKISIIAGIFSENKS